MKHSTYYYFRVYFFPRLYRLIFKENTTPATHPVIKSVCLLRPGKLGDLIMATVIIKQIKDVDPSIRIAVVFDKCGNSILEHNPYVDLKKNINFHSLFSLIGSVLWMRRQKFDAIVDLSPGPSTTNLFIVNRGANGAICIGSDKEKQERFYHFPVRFTNEHIVERNTGLCRALLNSNSVPAILPQIYTADKNRTQAAKIINSHLNKTKIIVGLNLSAGRQARQLPEQWYTRFLQTFYKNPAAEKITLAMLAVTPQREMAESISKKFPNAIAIPPASFLTVCELMRSFAALVSPDTSLIHVASAFAIPVVGLYTSDNTNFDRWRPYRVPQRIVRSSTSENLYDADPVATAENLFALLLETKAL